jgi:hypothetical protein
MKRIVAIVAVAMMTVFAALSGCSKKEKEKASETQSVQNAAQPAAPGKSSPATSSPQDEAEADTLKTQVLAQVKNKDFAGIYRGASAGFREVGPEDRFVAAWDKQLLETGAFKDARQTSHAVRPTDKFQVYTYLVRYENMNKELRLIFGRSSKGKMELTGINQHAIPAAVK